MDVIPTGAPSTLTSVRLEKPALPWAVTLAVTLMPAMMKYVLLPVHVSGMGIDGKV